MEAAARWRELLSGPADRIPLDEAALLVSAHARPGLDVAAQLGRLDRLASAVDGDGAAAVGEVLFGRLGLRGDTATYDDPRNSYLDRVLDRGRGIPISLSILLIEVGRRRGVQLEGVAFPGHFLVRDRTRPDTLIDAFGAGRHLDRAACVRLWHTVVGPDAPFDPAALAPAPVVDILGRVLANLERSFRNRGDPLGLGWVAGLRAALPGQSPGRRLELAATLDRLGRHDQAATVLDALADDPRLAPATAAEVRRRAVATHAHRN
jgi:regulator of sirC expression with transglutaminase-like and TPR domain